MKTIVDFLRLIRFPNLVIIALTQYAIRFGIIYPFLSQAELSLFLSEKLFALLVISTVMIAASGYIINDYFDVKLDLINKPKQLVIGEGISRRKAMFLHLIINSVALFFASYVALSIGHPLLIFFQLGSVVLLWFYSISFKKQILVGNFIIAILTALVPFTAGYYEIAVMLDHMNQSGLVDLSANKVLGLGSFLFSIQYLLYWISGYSIFAFILTLIREIIKDCEDIEGDKAFSCRTYPIVYGIPKAKNLAFAISIILLILLAAIEWIQFRSEDFISFAYFTVLLSAPLLWVSFRIRKAQKKRDFFIVSQTVKLLMLLGILYTGVIYLF